MAVGTDSIVIPVELGNLDVEKFLQQIGPKLKKRIAEVAQGMVGGEIPLAKPTVVAKERFDVAGRTYEATARARLTAIEQSIGESGERDIVALEKFAVNIKEVKKKVSDSITADAKRFAEFKKSLQFLKLEDRGPAINEALKQGNITVQQFNQLIAQEQRKLQQQNFRRLRVQLVSLKGEDRLIAVEEAIKRGNQPIIEINRLLEAEKRKLEQFYNQKLKASLPDLKVEHREKLAKFKADISIQLPEEKIKSIQQATREGLLTIQEGNVLLAKESKKFVDSVKSARRQRFGEFAKRLQTIDPNIAIKELDQYINQRTSAFVQDAKILRDRLNKQIQSARQQAQQTRNRNFANQALIGAGIGLGALGNAGFPLLNIGFAAMSGGPIGAAIVGVATALGEGTRAFNRFRETTIGAAKEIGLVSTNFKNAEAQMKSINAFIGSGALTSQTVGMEERIRALTKSAGDIKNISSNFTNFIETVKTRFTKNVTGTDEFTTQDLLPGQAGGEIRRFFQEFIRQQEETQKRTLPDLLSAQRNFNIMLNRPTVGIETNPYETWRRIQTAAFDPSKQLEMEQQRKMVEKLTELVEEAKAAAAREEEKKNSKWYEGAVLLGTL